MSQVTRLLIPAKKEWGIGQVQSIINGKVTINFENVGKKVINISIDQDRKNNQMNLE